MEGKGTSLDKSAPNTGFSNVSASGHSSTTHIGMIVGSLLSMIAVGVVAVMLVLHFTRKLPANFYTLGGLFKDKTESQSFDLYLEKDVETDINQR